MIELNRFMVCCGLALCLPAIVCANTRTSTININNQGDLLAAVNNDSRSVTLISLPDHIKTGEIFVGRDPQTLAFDPAGNFLYVTNRLDDSVSVLSVTEQTRVNTIPVGDEPVGVVIAPDGTVYVSCTGSNTIELIDPVAGQVTGFIDMEDAPRGLALSADASELYVTHFTSGRLSVINTVSLEVEAFINTGADTNLSNSVALNGDGSLAYLPQTRSNVTNEALLFDTTVFPIVSVVDLETRLHHPPSRIHLDISDEPVNMPFDTALVGETTLYVMNSGSNDISVINLENAQSLAHLDTGDNPGGMALSADESRLYVNNRLSGDITVIDTGTHTVMETIASTRIPLRSDILNGKRLFHRSDRADLARDQWISCATCHFDGETDKRTWFFPDGLRNTTSLLGVADTLPVHWSGDLDELQDVEITVRDIQAGTGLVEGGDHCDPACDQGEPNAGRSQDLDDLAAFMTSLQLSPNPNLEAGGTLNEAAARGKELFESEAASCSECHIAPLYTDSERHDVGTGDDPGERKGTEFDTPSLRGIYKTPPYLHLGTAGTLMDVLTTQNPGDLHGKTSHLQVAELQDLVAFLNSIGTMADFEINAGLNDAWVNAEAPLQGFFVTVFPVSKLIFIAWFTFDTEPANGVPSFGAADQRWITALGTYEGNSSVLTAELTSGGLFNASTPVPTQDTNYGTITIEFTDCRNGIIKFDFPAASLSGEFAISQALESNVALCETLSG